MPRHELDGVDRVRLIGITGPAGCGKDTLAGHFAREYGAEVRSLASPIKAALNSMFGFEGIQWHDREWKERVLPVIGCSPRHLAQTLGTEWGRGTISPSVWVDAVLRKWRIDGRPLTVVPDVRFDNEASRIVNAGGVVLGILRPGVAPVREHVSEAGVSGELIDAVVNNSGSLACLYAAGEAAVSEALRSQRDSL